MNGYQMYPGAMPYGYYAAHYGDREPLTTVGGTKYVAFPVRFGPVRGLLLGAQVAGPQVPQSPTVPQQPPPSIAATQDAPTRRSKRRSTPAASGSKRR